MNQSNTTATTKQKTPNDEFWVGALRYFKKVPDRMGRTWHDFMLETGESLDEQALRELDMLSYFGLLSRQTNPTESVYTTRYMITEKGVRFMREVLNT